MRIPEVAKHLGIARNTVQAIIDRGELKAYRIGRQFRISVEDFKAYTGRRRLRRRWVGRADRSAEAR
ncbi:MAG: helix-turn-helix domain-containing protein [Blastopirellula sp. JB062]